MTRNRRATALAALLLVWLCTPSITAQAAGAPQPQKDFAEISKTAVSTGPATWEVTLRIKGGGTQKLTQPVDIVLLLDCSAGMAAPIAPKVAPEKKETTAVPKEVARKLQAAAQAAVQATSAEGALPDTARKGKLFAIALRVQQENMASGQSVKNSVQSATVPSLLEKQLVGENLPEDHALGMTQQRLPTEHKTRMSVAKHAVQAFLAALIDAQVPARIGIIGYAGTAKELLPLTVLDTASEGANTALHNAVENLWQAANAPGDLCYGSGRGTNLERALAAAGTMLKKGSAAASYVVTLGGTQPRAVGEQEQSCLVPEANPAYAGEMKVAFDTRAAVQALMEQGTARVFTVGVGTSELSAYASTGAAYTAQEKDAAAPLQEIAALLDQRVQSPAVTDSAGEGLVIQPAGVTCTPTSVGVGAQPYVSVAQDGKTLYWNLGAWLPAEQTATLCYTLKVADALYSTAGKDLPLGGATLVYSTPQENGTLQSLGVPFQPPTVRYVTGALRVYSSGLPAQLSATAQNVSATPVTGTAFFQLQKPAEHSGWRIESVVVNGETHTPVQFATDTNYRLPVKEGVTVVEYHYVPAPVPDEQWTYHVQYFRDGLLLPDGTDLGTVPAVNPVVTGVKGRLNAVPDCVENPVRTWPYTLRKNGEALRVDYLTQPREGAQVYVRHVYQDTSGAQMGTHTTSPAADAASYNVRDLFAPGYGGGVYMPTLATLTATSVDGTQAQSQSIALGDGFSGVDKTTYLLEICYVPLAAEHTAH